MNEDRNVNVDPGMAPEVSETQGEITPPVTSTTPPLAQKRPIKLIIAALITALIIVLIGGSVFGYAMWYQNPDKVVHDAVLNAIKADSISATGLVTYVSDDVKMDIALDSKSGEGNAEFSVTAKVTIDTAATEQDFEATGTGRVIDDTLYIKLNGVKEIVEDTTGKSGGAIPGYAPDIFEKIEDRWISINASDYRQVSEKISSQQTCFLNLMEKMQSDSSMSNEIGDLYRDNQVIVIDKELGMKDINGVNSLGFKVSLDKEAAGTFVQSLEETSFGKEIKKCDKDIDFEEITQKITHNSTGSKKAPVTELWVSSFGHRLTEIAVYGYTNDQDALNILLHPVFDENVTIEIPENVTPLRTVLGEIQQAIMRYNSGEVPMSEMTLPADSDNGGIDPQLQAAV